MRDQLEGDITSFFRTGRPQRTLKKEIVLGWEEKLAYIYYIQKGFIKAYSVSADGDELIHAVYGPGEIFPLPWAYSGVQYVDYYETLANALLFRVSLSQFEVFSQSTIATSYALTQLLAGQFNAYSYQIDNLQYKKPSQRLAYRLLFLASKFGSKEEGRIVIDGPFTHQLIADTINLARETVSREIEYMQYTGLLGQEGRRIVIKNLPGLKMKLGGRSDYAGWGLD